MISRSFILCRVVMLTNNTLFASPEADSATELEPNVWRDLYQAGERNFADKDFCGVNLSSSGFSYVQLDRCLLQQSNFQNADLRGVSLKDTRLQSTTLAGANLQGADLRGAQLTDCTLYGANLRGANLCGVDLRQVDLGQVNLHGAYCNEATQFPDGFDARSAGLRFDAALIESVLKHLNQLSDAASRYLGNALVVKYWESCRSVLTGCPELAAIQCNEAGQFQCNGLQIVSLAQMQTLQILINQFVGSCALIFQDLPDILNQKNLIVLLPGAHSQ